MLKPSHLSPRISSLLPQLDRRFMWIGLGFLTFILTQLFSWNPTFTEIVYSRGLFLGWRWIWDRTIGLLPFPVLYLLLAGLIFWVGRKSWKTLKNFRGVKWRHRLGSLFLSLLAFVSFLYFLFQFMWGFNYYRVPIEEQLRLELTPLDSTDVREEFAWATRQMLKDRSQIPLLTEGELLYDDLPQTLEKDVRIALEKALAASQYPINSRVRGRILQPKGSLLRMGASGIYIPFVGEGHIDAALAPASRPFTLAHELSHGYGFGDEGTANFWGYLATQEAEHPAIRYSGSLTYWRYTAKITHPVRSYSLSSGTR